MRMPQVWLSPVAIDAQSTAGFRVSLLPSRGSRGTGQSHQQPTRPNRTADDGDDDTTRHSVPFSGSRCITVDEPGLGFG